MSYFDSDVTKYLGVFTVFLVLFSVVLKWARKRNCPPGPIGLPIVGYYPFLGEKPHVKLRDLSKKYGDIFSFKIGPQLVICVTEYHLCKEILKHPSTLSRPPHAFDFFEAGKGGFGGMNGEEWQEQRRFAIQTMRNLGLGKGLWETMIQEDAGEHVKYLLSTAGKPVFFAESLGDSQARNGLSLLFGRHLDPVEDGDHLQDIRKLRKKMMEHVSSVDVGLNLPCMMKLLEFFNLFGVREFIAVLRKVEAFFGKEVEKRSRSDENLNKDDFIGVYLQEIKKRDKEGMPHTFTKMNLQGNLFILYIAGQDATVASVGWLLLLMAQHHDVQDRICREIDEAIGRDGTVYYDDKVKLPYTMATMMEMMRWISISSIFPPRYVEESFSINGYEIPQGANIICNAWAMMHDPRYFEDSMTFRPERFLTDGGDKWNKIDGYGPFSFGRRNCPGEGVAIMTMYLYFVSIMQKFNIRTPDGGPPDLTYKFSAGILPNEQKLRFVER